MTVTTVKVSKDTVRQLAALQRSIGAQSLEATIQMLVKRHRSEIIDGAFAADHGKIKPFSEEDRGEDRR